MARYWNSFVEMIVSARFFPLETILAGGIVLSSVAILSPATSINFIPAALQGVIAGTGVIVGLTHLYGAYILKTPAAHKVRACTSFWESVGFGYIAVLALIVNSKTCLVWVPFLLLTLISGIVYLNVASESEDYRAECGES